MTSAAIDNDILYKGACYGLVVELIRGIPATLEDVGFLFVARFVVRAKLRKATLVRAAAAALELMEGVIARAQSLEPSIDEVRVAAELEHAAARANLDLDVGESQLCAIVLARGLPKLVTGDKRAIAALEVLLGAANKAGQLAGRVLCLEQLVRSLLNAGKGPQVRDAVCGEPSVDRALTACFSCTSPEVGPERWAEGLTSYINSLRSSAPSVMADG